MLKEMSVDSKIVDKLEELLDLLKKDKCKCDDCECGKPKPKSKSKCPLSEGAQKEVKESVKDCPFFDEEGCPFAKGCPFVKATKVEEFGEPCTGAPDMLGILILMIFVFVFVLSLLRLFRSC